MKKTFYLRHKKSFEKFNGLLLGNTVLERGLVLSPVIVASYNYQNSIILGISFVMITFFTVLLSSFIPKKIPYTIRSIFYTLIACAIFIPTAMWMDSIYPEQVFKLGIFLPLLVANSLIVVKSESRFHKHKKGMMIVDLLCHTIGFFLVIVLVGTIREIIGNGTLMGQAISLPFKVPAIIYPFSGFILVGFLAALVKRIKYKLENPKERNPIAVPETK
ncbi:Rnf-Nqr domain containing protein [Paludicola sp. MB14-C6]|uniref:Rnf-Nqr domain containing protein n=1 Tax=Paludihabitans sp. MB14-C6 TaxID=3070656 RepID=UPI0027DE60EB|nr:Rnf-Nqr domain containing protein [Paludicola sp. MB14-C6]WMJ23803.1 Rnf-Nqr domain containing protein [Paludicola sp. MB14-C6]